MEICAPQSSRNDFPDIYMIAGPEAVPSQRSRMQAVLRLQAPGTRLLPTCRRPSVEWTAFGVNQRYVFMALSLNFSHCISRNCNRTSVLGQRILPNLFLLQIICFLTFNFTNVHAAYGE